jgi:hypothetical protein
MNSKEFLTRYRTACISYLASLPDSLSKEDRQSQLKSYVQHLITNDRLQIQRQLASKMCELENRKLDSLDTMNDTLATVLSQRIVQSLKS